MTRQSDKPGIKDIKTSYLWAKRTVKALILTKEDRV